MPRLRLPDAVAAAAIVLLALPVAGAWAQSPDWIGRYNEVRARFEAGRFAESFELAAQVVAEAERDLGPEHPAVGRALLRLGVAARRLDRRADARGAAARARSVLETALGPDHLDLCNVFVLIGNVALDENDLVQADAAFARALRIAERQRPPAAVDAADALSSIGSVRLRQSRLADADAAYREGLRRLDGTAGAASAESRDRLQFNIGVVAYVPDGAMQSLPLAALLTAPPGGDAARPGAFARWKWLADRWATSTMPSEATLQALCTALPPALAPEPFGGFGDPLLDGRGGVRAASTRFTRRGAVADVDEVRRLARLPETALELRSLARALAAPATNVFVGAQATEARVKATDLSRWNAIAFATHGLLGGEFVGLTEPALALTPPAHGSEQDDGLLTASEVALLKLNADWVLLSACNTAGKGGRSDGLGELARAFFYAGARALLVSHWAVDSRATVTLTTRMMQERAGGADKAIALQRAMRAVREAGPRLAHPMYWAAFSVVGEAGTQPARVVPH